MDSELMSVFGCNKLAYWSFEELLSDLLKTMAYSFVSASAVASKMTALLILSVRALSSEYPRH